MLVFSDGNTGDDTKELIDERGSLDVEMQEVDSGEESNGDNSDALPDETNSLDIRAQEEKTAWNEYKITSLLDKY